MPNASDGEHLLAMITFKFSAKITHTPGILTSGDFHPDTSGGHVVPRWKSPDVTVDCEFGWKSSCVMGSVSLRWKSPDRPDVMFRVSFGWKSNDVMVRVIFLFPCWSLKICQNWQNYTNLKFSIWIWGLGALFGGPQPTNSPCGDGTGRTWNMKVSSSAAINLIAQQLCWSICPFWACLPYVPGFRKTFAHFGQGWLLWLKIAMKIDKFHVSTWLTFIADRTTHLKWGSV